MTTDVLQPCRARSCIPRYISSFVSPHWNRTTSLGMEASCKQRCNVVEQTPSRRRVASHFVCSIYQSKADNEIYEWNKGSHRLWVNNGSQRKRNAPFISLFLKGAKDKVQKKLVRIKNVSPSVHSKCLPKYQSYLLRSCWVMQQKARKNSLQ